MIEWQEYWAHSPNDSGKAQFMEEHLRLVAEMAAMFAQKFGGQDLALRAGWFHDIGKFSDEFQDYLRRCHQDKLAGKKGKTVPGGGDHKRAGARLASRLSSQPITNEGMLILGHHGGLPARTDSSINQSQDTSLDVVIERAQSEINVLNPPFAQISLPQAAGSSTSPNVRYREREMFLRMVFSCLVDADSLDTERHFQSTKYDKRIWTASLQEWKKLLDYRQNELQAYSAGAIGKAAEVNRVRNQVYTLCVEAGAKPQGAFSLTVPTGGGKTLSSFAFALTHATASDHPLERIIYAIPYTSIIDQTAGVFRDILGDDAPMLVHHSALPDDPKNDNGQGETSWRRLASQNWDAPLVVTTTVQLFESLFANSPGHCRKLHNMANSVIILDEAQMLPIGLLNPILDALKLLVKYYGTTVVFCTATQPAFDVFSKELKGFKEIMPIIPPEQQLAHFSVMKRVEYKIEQEEWEWAQVADVMCKDDSKQCLAVVNTRANAIALLEALNDPDAFHLSTLLCGAHRTEVLKQVRERLKQRQPCRLVSTQCIECGVDVDFPRVLRAVGPFDRIVQAAGRCNREGLLSMGEVIIFTPAKGALPHGEYQTAVAITKALLREQNIDFHDPTIYRRYFLELYGDNGAIVTDKPGIQALRTTLDYPGVARSFRMIEQDTRPVLVCYEPERKRFEQIKAAAQSGRMDRGTWRRAQPLLVNLYTSDIKKHSDQLEELIPDALYLWTGEYDTKSHRGMVGITLDPADPIYKPENLLA